MDEQLDKMIEDFKSIEEFKVYIYAQKKTITDQSRKLFKLDNEIKDLKKQLLSFESKELPPIQSELLMGTDSEVIAKIQLAKLKEVSFEREFTLDECKRAEILVKILNANKKIDEKATGDKPMAIEDLMRIVEGI